MALVFKPAFRHQIGLVVGIAGSTGSGKSLSALMMSRGLAALPGEDLNDPRTLALVDSRIKAIDTEAGRLLHYAPPQGELPGRFTFGFQHGDMLPPYSPAAYRENIAEIQNSCSVVLVDSISHVWSGEGGMHDMQTAEVERMLKRNINLEKEAITSLAWKGPKVEHRKMVSKMMQSRAHLVICMRAEEKLKIEKIPKQGGGYRTVYVTPAEQPIEERWVPECDKKLPYELGMSFLVTAKKPGWPIPLKLEEQHKAFVPLDRPLSVEVGRQLGDWARGEIAAPTRADESSMPKGWDGWSLEERGTNRANAGLTGFRAFWKTLTVDEKAAAKQYLPAWQETAEKKP